MNAPRWYCALSTPNCAQREFSISTEVEIPILKRILCKTPRIGISIMEWYFVACCFRQQKEKRTNVCMELRLARQIASRVLGFGRRTSGDSPTSFETASRFSSSKSAWNFFHFSSRLALY